MQMDSIVSGNREGGGLCAYILTFDIQCHGGCVKIEILYMTMPYTISKHNMTMLGPGVLFTLAGPGQPPS